MQSLKGVRIHFNEKCIGADVEAGVVRFKGTKGKHQVKADWILGADGAFSGLTKKYFERPTGSITRNITCRMVIRN